MRYALPMPGGPTRTVALRRHGLRGLGAIKSATDFLTMQEIQFLANVWRSIRVAANWTDIGWKGMGYPNGPPLSATANAIIQATWGSIRRAANFSDINWAAESIPANLLPATAPVVAPPAPVVATPNYNGSPLNSVEYATVAGVWPTIRGAANWKDIGWPGLGYPNGPNLSAAADKIMADHWGSIRRAKWFQDINWTAELGASTPAAAQPVPEITPTITTPTVTTIVAPESPPARVTIPEAAPNAVAPVDTTHPAAQPVPEIQGPSGVAVSGPTSIPSWWESLFNTSPASPAAQPVPDILAPGSADSSSTPKSLPAPIQAGMFGDLSKTWWIWAAAGFGIYLMYGGKKKGRIRGRARRRA